MLSTNYNCFNAKCFVFVASSLLMLALPLLAKPESPNFVVVYMDDLGWADTSVPMIKGREETRSDFYLTPGLERLRAC